LVVCLATFMKKKQRIPRRPEFEALAPYLGPCKKPRTVEAKVIELIDGTLMFDGFPGFEEACFVVGRIMKENGIDVKSPRGERIAKAYVDHALQEMYGDFNRFAECSDCGKSFRPEYSTDYFREVIGSSERCAECKIAEAQRKGQDVTRKKG